MARRCLDRAPGRRGASRSRTGPPGTVNDAMPFDHIVVVMMENHSFDNLLGALGRHAPRRRRADLRRRRQATNTNPDGASPPAEVASFACRTPRRPRTSRRAGRPRTNRSTAARWTGSSGPRRARASRWATTRRRCCHSHTRWRARSRSPTAGSARFPARPTRTAGSCSPARRSAGPPPSAERALPRRTSAERHDLRPPLRPRNQLGATTSPTSR